CKPLMNIHDFAVMPAYRGKGVGTQLLNRVKQLARNLGCCKVTLEVLDGNQAGKALYHSQGFAPYTLGQDSGQAIFMQCPIEGTWPLRQDQAGENCAAVAWICRLIGPTAST